MDIANLSILLLALGMGLLHALDADHVIAMSTIVSCENRLKRIAQYSMLWGGGHGGIILLVTIAFIYFDWAFPQTWSLYAEKTVGILLILLGAQLLFKIYVSKLQLLWHKHGNLAHFHFVKRDEIEAHQQISKHNLWQKHKPLLVGILHGLAGSAPMLAILPGISGQRMNTGLAYVAIFTLGCLVGMLAFGLGLGLCQRKLAHIHLGFSKVLQTFSGAISLGIGCYWLT
ncbi:hypothetical protein [Catenovulum adriaticum]|uniref:ABC-type nickel/cobalt efflux system permease component RcnA n=1 Tax=Catenovulum adriaticum TaxID=2984846 RepID=A0ABY7ARV9_9ALTE|nr:hypothetical protein [Catenovulum sp. TS8]WAJ72275.1 hypothetical protein OLW01_16160 [Catenovulum sp. TS8]